MKTHDEMTTDDIALRIACCIERTRIITKSLDLYPDWDCHEYWYTREAAQPFARKLGVSFIQIGPLLGKVQSLSDIKIRELSEPYWPDLAPPAILLREVMES